MATSVISKLGLKPGARAYLSGAPDDVARMLSSDGMHFSSRLGGAFTYMQAFFVSASKLDTRFPTLKKHLAPGGSLWISWPKAGQLDSDLTLPKVIEIGYRHGLVESKSIGIDTAWSALKFTHPIKGKTYQNSHGRLPDNADAGVCRR